MKNAACGIAAVLVVMLMVGGYFTAKPVKSFVKETQVAQATQAAERAAALGQ